MSYYERPLATHLDGSPIFRNADDERIEGEVASVLAEHWHCNVRSFGVLSAVDWFAERDGRVIGLIEMKSRSHASTTYETVFLNVRKWLALTLGSVGFGVPALFVVQFLDGIYWVNLRDVDATRISVAGCVRPRAMQTRSSVEPVVEVPISCMKVV